MPELIDENHPWYVPPPVDDTPPDADSGAAEYPTKGPKGGGKGGGGAALPSKYHTHREFLNVTSRAKELTPHAVLVWLVLWDDTDRETGLAKSAQSWIGDRARLSKSSVIRAMKELREKGLVEIVNRGCNRHNQISVYRINHK